MRGPLTTYIESRGRRPDLERGKCHDSGYDKVAHYDHNT